MSVTNTDDSLDRRELDRKINGRAEGAFLIWIGLALLLGAGWGVGLVGVGVILLVEQLARRRFALKYERFWVAVGVVASVFGIGIAVGLQDALVPFLLVVVGGVLVATTFIGRAKS